MSPVAGGASKPVPPAGFIRREETLEVDAVSQKRDAFARDDLLAHSGFQVFGILAKNVI